VRKRNTFSFAMRKILLLLTLWLAGADGLSSSVTFLQRDALHDLLPADALDGEMAAPQDECTFDGGKLILSHPMDLHPNDRFFTICHFFQKGYELTIDALNAYPHCGVKVGGRNYGLVLHSYGEGSSAVKAAAIARAVEPTTDFFLAPYTSGITEGIAQVANDSNKIMVAPGSFFTSVFRDRPSSFGLLPLPELYLKQVMPMLAQVGAHTVLTIYEAGGPAAICQAIGPLAATAGITVTDEVQVPSSPTPEDFLALARKVAALDPDVVVTCVYEDACASWVHAMREVGWSPRAQVFSTCVGLTSFSQAVGTDAEFMIGMSPWEESLEIQDALTQWTPRDFAALFEKFSGYTTPYHGALGQAAISVLAQAIEAADSLVTEDIARALSNTTFETAFGSIAFDENGQNNMDLIATQADEMGQVQVVYPPKLAAVQVVYPMPTWAERDCRRHSECGNQDGAYAGECQKDGTCVCQAEDWFPRGVGVTAACHFIPTEEMTYIESAIKSFGYCLVGVQSFASFFCIAWTLWFRSRDAVRSAQPVFLNLVALGCLILSLSIIPLTVEESYRFELDEVTRKESDIPNESIGRADSACMAFPWLLGMGFAVTFSALFAKIWRIRRIVLQAQLFRRVKVEAKDVASIIVGVVSLQGAVLLTWQLVSPLQWKRTVEAVSDLGFPTESVGSCASDHSLGFSIVLFAINICCLLIALWLCWVSRDFPSHINEAKWITVSVLGIFQVLLLAAPVSVIAQSDTSASFFVKSTAIFISSMAVTCLIFVPKMINLHVRIESDGRKKVAFAERSSTLNREDSARGSISNILQDPSNRGFQLRSLDEEQGPESGRFNPRTSVSTSMTNGPERAFQDDTRLSHGLDTQKTASTATQPADAASIVADTTATEAPPADAQVTDVPAGDCE
jgi:branched-chain amino acid transport system substrate-binding protein